MIKVLAIGNSFSDDARTYIPQIAAASGIDLMIGNLYIGGCQLDVHDKNATEDAVAYHYTKTGYPARAASIREALEEEDWDFVTMQQASHFSGLWETYQPYLTRLSEYVKKYAPQAEQLIHETWAYETTSGHGGFARYDRDQMKMYTMLRECYERAAHEIGDVRIIPCGDAMQIARSYPIFDYAAGKRSLNRDGFHASWTHGRYLLGLVWVEMLTGADLSDNAFVPQLAEYPNDTPTAEEIAALKKAAHAAITARYGK
jgi:hypothetical protein